MTIAELEDKIEGCVPTGYRFFSGRKSEYNFEKLVSDIVLFIPPREWPLNWRSDCSYDVEVEIWIGKIRSPKTQQLTAFRDALNTTATTMIDAINEINEILVVESDVQASYWSTDEGQSVNTQEFVSFTLLLRIWST